jgi:hypothetical protein
MSSGAPPRAAPAWAAPGTSCRLRSRPLTRGRRAGLASVRSSGRTCENDRPVGDQRELGEGGNTVVCQGARSGAPDVALKTLNSTKVHRELYRRLTRSGGPRSPMPIYQTDTPHARRVQRPRPHPSVAASKATRRQHAGRTSVLPRVQNQRLATGSLLPFATTIRSPALPSLGGVGSAGSRWSCAPSADSKRPPGLAPWLCPRTPGPASLVPATPTAPDSPNPITPAPPCGTLPTGTAEADVVVIMPKTPAGNGCFCRAREDTPFR